MAKRITVTALRPLLHEGRSYVRGSVFTATPVDAASLKYRGKVKLGGQLSGGMVPEHPSVARRMEPVNGFQADASPEVGSGKPEPPTLTNEETVEQVEQSIDAPADATPADAAESAPAPRGRRSRAYQRRDMQAEEPNS